ncbi:acyl-CoA dehydrogenase family protein [Nocardia sp. NBC_00565]|uniref:acyl-CoA dehydrogenase family protein n=1 Tax=Nocardia sp. NBC_00565 TaxID=2975993 RepID=UPI002E809523|nr:acyl-CoA dehydrogenase family protein [Nocardia sp. NBC_00565]WUC05772.1 acyl-CoA dehydrogenase family protein [Nocardia sp. NBC_00565]
MTDTFAADLDSYRTALRANLMRESSLHAWRTRHYATTEERIADHAALMGELYRQGWNRYGWPVAAGGAGGDERHRAVLYDELAAAGLPIPTPHLLLETLGPPVSRFAPELAARYLPAYLRGEEWWGQGFSEPEAGSDLASLRCRARRDGDNYVLSGQKLWTSHGATATRLVCLVRTGTPESRHRGLSMIMVDVDTPGVSRRPIALASGDNELAEVFFDDAIVPASRLIGAEGQGWAIAMYLLQYERAMYAWMSAADALRRLRELRDQLSTRLAAGGTLPGAAAQRLGQCYSQLITLRARSAQTVRRLAAGATVGPEASVDKVLLGGAEIALYDLSRDLLGPEFVFDDTATVAQWRSEWWYSRSATILGGSAEVQRTIIADHVLGLPKEATV